MLAKKRKTSQAVKVPKAKTPRQMERHLKGVSNHRRIEILFLIAEHRGSTVDMIAIMTKTNLKTISGHILRLEYAGLIRKLNVGRSVSHDLSPYGKTIYTFLKTFSHS